MALNATMGWYVRAGGSASNSGGFDASVSGAGVNYADQDAAQVTFSAGNSNQLSTSGAGATTVTSAGTPFTSSMVGNVIRISAGTNFQTGYYTIITYTSSSSVVLDRTPSSGGAGSVGDGTLGGAFATPWGSLATVGPTLTSPLAAGHQINVRGAGTDDPGTADYTSTSEKAYIDGGLGTTGRIRWVGYNGRPRIDTSTRLISLVRAHNFSNFVFVRNGGTANTNPLIQGTTSSWAPNYFYNCKVDQAGYDSVGLQGALFGCEFVNSGSTTTGTQVAMLLNTPYNIAIGNRVTGWRGGGIQFSIGGTCVRNIVDSCHSTTSPGVIISFAGANDGGLFSNNVVFGCAHDGIEVSADDAVAQATIINNISYGNADYGLNLVGTAAYNDRIIGIIDYNAFGDNGIAATNGYNQQGNDVALTVDPFTDSATGDFSLNNTAGGGAELVGVGYPVSIP